MTNPAPITVTSPPLNRSLEDVVTELCQAVYELSQRVNELERVKAWMAEQLAKLGVKPEPCRDDPEEEPAG